MIKTGSEELQKIYEDCASGRLLRDKIVVEMDDINNIDTLVLIRAMSGDFDVTTFAPVLEAALDGHTIKFTLDNEVLQTVSYNRGGGNKLHLLFGEKPYLYDILQQTVYALLLKKLTPHLEGSN